MTSKTDNSWTPTRKLSGGAETKKLIKGKRQKITVAPEEGHDFRLDEKYYETIGELKIFETEKRVAKIFGARNRKNGEESINIKSKSKRPFGWRFNTGVSLYNALHINNLFRSLRLIAKRLGWSNIDNTTNIEELKNQLREKEESILTLEKANKEERVAHGELMKRFREQQVELLKIKQKDLLGDITALRELIGRTEQNVVKENELQEFLYSHPWIFGTEYINAEPQKLRGAHSRFDFYLERFNKTKDIVEIKLLSNRITNKDGGINAEVIQAIDQLIEYMESSMAAAHSTVISEEEGISELRPRGIVIIGSDDSKDVKEKLHKWNYQLAHITILTYKDILEKAEAVLRHIDTNATQHETKQ